MAEYEKKVREILKRNGFTFHHHGRGDHDIWFNEQLKIKVTVDSKIKSRHMANLIMKEAGIIYHF
jgi:predicted RNA binding protein YcfA (HicA-like mRNA interferase family)